MESGEKIKMFHGEAEHDIGKGKKNVVNSWFRKGWTPLKLSQVYNKATLGDD